MTPDQANQLREILGHVRDVQKRANWMDDKVKEGVDRVIAVQRRLDEIEGRITTLEGHFTDVADEPTP